MKPWIKLLIGVASGFAGGFAAGFFCHKKMNDIQFEEIDESEMQAIEETLKNGKEEGKSDEDLPFLSAIEKADPQNTDELRNAMQGKVNYSKADEEAKERFKPTWETVRGYSDEENADSLPIDPEEGLDEEFLEMIEQEEVEPGQMEPPHVISLGEFYNERPEYDKITIDWYEPDNVYLDENEEIIGDISSYVGLNASALFKESGPQDDPDIRFVRNEQYGSDYEIIRHHRSYRETMGEG
jgi:hypothetical protein